MDNEIQDAEFSESPKESSPPQKRDNPAGPGIVAAIPLVPVQWTGPGATWAYGRVIAYGGAAALVWRRNRRAGSLLAGAALLAAATSTLAHAG